MTPQKDWSIVPVLDTLARKTSIALLKGDPKKAFIASLFGSTSFFLEDIRVIQKGL